MFIVSSKFWSVIQLIQQDKRRHKSQSRFLDKKRLLCLHITQNLRNLRI